MTPDELIDDVCPRIRDLGWAYYFVEETTARGDELGLDFLRWYFLGRGGGLGDIEGSVARASFGYFEPGMFTTMWDSARAEVDPRTAGAEHYLCAASYGRRKLAEVGSMDAFCDAAQRVVDAADDTALTLFAAYRAAPLVDDAPGRAMQLLATLREFRGSAHLLALRAVGLDSIKAHTIARPNDLGMFGWTAETAPPVSDGDRALRDEAEALTDRVVRPAFASLDDDAQEAFVSGIDRIEAALTG